MRSDSRLLHFCRADRTIAHRQFTDLPSLLHPGDLLVLNDARVIPARFDLLKPTGGKVEGLFLEEHAPGQWDVLLRDLGKAAIGTELTFAADPSVKLQLNASQGEGAWQVRVTRLQTDAMAFLDRVGRMPLPPYIRRNRSDAPDLADLDRDRYQTVYAAQPGSVAAPTAGLHFTPEVVDACRRAGVAITLHVGLGTFKPITSDDLDNHQMHFERYDISPAAADTLNAAKSAGRRIVAVGTTAARVLESQGNEFFPRQDRTNLFIRPPYQWKHAGALLTNFHLPRSTLIALVAAFVGLENQREIYQQAIAHRYRFFSYGDTSFLE